MKKFILVLNCGSLSIRWKLFEENNLKLIKAGLPAVATALQAGHREILISKNYSKILKKEIKKLKKYPIKVVGHRIVHGGEKLREPTKITPKIIRELEKLNILAPLHNPFNILGIKISQKIFKKIPQIAVFDTEFFKDLPPKSCIYPIPQNLAKKYNLKRFGFHGISHQFLAQKAAEILKKPFKKLNLITCHLGGGSSITAIKNGKPIDTSMGFTPMEGLPMMTRAGDIDPGIILYLSQKLKVKSQKLNYIFNYKSGLKGISGLSNCKKLVQRAIKGNKIANLTLEIYVYRIQKYIGAYFAILGKCHALVFTGAIGYKSKYIRDKIIKNLSILKKTKIMAIETNEEFLIVQKITKNFKI